MRTCLECGEEKPNDAFLGTRKTCRACINAKRREEGRPGRPLVAKPPDQKGLNRAIVPNGWGF